MRPAVAHPDRLLPACPKALVFDWDNTLIDSWGVIGRVFNDTLVAFGKPAWSAAELRANVRHSLRDAFPVLFGADWKRARDHYYRVFGEIHLDMLKPLPGAAEMLRHFRAQGMYMAIVSNKSGSYLRREVAHLGWENFFAAVAGAGDAARDKPAVDPLLLALAPSGFAPGPDIWVIGDADVDMEMAHGAGCAAILAPGSCAAAMAARAAPDARFTDFQELIALAADSCR